MMDAKEKPMKPLFNLKEKNVLVTGGGRGLGKTMALALADFGANVAIVDINLDTAKIVMNLKKISQLMKG